MRAKLFLLAVCAGLLPLGAKAQYLYQFVFRGTSSQTSATGNFVTKPVNEKILLAGWAKHTSTSPRGLTLAYHVGGNELGDTIDVINASTGQVMGTLLGLYFGETFGRLALKNANDSQEKRLDYIYTDQISHSIGAALVNKKITPAGTNSVSRTTANGSMSWEVLPGGIMPEGIVTGNFQTGKLLTFKAKVP